MKVLADQAGENETNRTEVFSWLNVPLTWFMSAASQWIRDGDGRPVALNYDGLEAAARMMGITTTPADFTHVRTLEQETLAQIRLRAKRR